MFGLLNAPSPKRASSLGARPRSAPRLGEARHICRIDGSDNVPAGLPRGIGPCLPPRGPERGRKEGGQASYSPCALLGPTRRRRAPLAAASPQAASNPDELALASMGAHWDRPGSRRKKERGGGWRTRLNVASIFNVNETRACLDQHQLPRRAFSGQISATSGPCPHSTGVGNTMGTH